MNVLSDLLRRTRAALAVAIVAGLVSGGGTVALVALIQAELAREGPSSLRLGLAFAALCLLGVVARVLAHVATIRMSQEAIHQLCVQICRRALALPLDQFERLNTSALLTVLTQDAGMIAQMMSGLPQLCIDIPIIVGCLAYIGWLSPVVLAVGLVYAAIGVGTYLLLETRAIRLMLQARSGQDALVGHFRTLIQGVRELRQHRPRRLGFLADVLAPASLAVRDRTTAARSLFAVVVSWGQLAYYAFIGFVLFVLPGPAGIDRATLAGLVVVLLFLLSPLDLVVSLLPGIGAARASWRKIRDLLPSLGTQDVDDAPPIRLLALRESLQLDSVSYTYHLVPERDGSVEGEGFSLGPIDLSLHPGEIVFLAGGNGSGKTTLVKLLAGLYSPESGLIRLDGRPIGPDDREAYRQLFSVVFADGHLFRDLVGIEPHTLEERARDGLERVALAHKVRLDGRSYSTIDLSQGQRGRLSLLTTLLEDRPVCIFDEWAANQDPRFKRFFYHEILPELKAQGKAVLVISHDEAYYDLADRLVRLRDGLIHAEDVLAVEKHPL